MNFYKTKEVWFQFISVYIKLQVRYSDLTHIYIYIYIYIYKSSPKPYWRSNQVPHVSNSQLLSPGQ